MNDPILPPPMHPPTSTIAPPAPDAGFVLAAVLTDLDAELASACVLRDYRNTWPEVLRDTASRVSAKREREALCDAITAWGERRDAACVALCDEFYSLRGGL